MNFDLKSTPRRSSVGSIRRPGSGAKFEDRVSRFQRLSQRRSSLGTTPALSNDHSHHDISKRIKVEIEERINDYEFNVNFYSIPPFGRVHLQEAEEFIKERLNSKKPSHYANLI